MRLPENFDREVCAVAAQIPHGRVATYGQLARLIGFPAHARRVGRALAAAPPEIPCHRVVDSRGGTVAAWPRQRELLEAEGIRFRENGRLDLNRYGWELLRTAKP